MHIIPFCSFCNEMFLCQKLFQSDDFWRLLNGLEYFSLTHVLAIYIELLFFVKLYILDA